MGFNREDLITWNELSTSLQNTIKAISDANINLETKVDENLEKTDKIDNRVTALEEASGSHAETIQRILNELDILNRVSESSLLRTVLELKAKLEFHKIDPNAHKFTIDTLMRSKSNDYYSAWRKVSVPNLKTFLQLEAADHRITNSATLYNSYDLGSVDVVEEEDYEKTLKSILEAWISKFIDTKSDIVVSAIKQLHREIFEHIWSTSAHNFNKSVFIGKNVNFVFEKGYKAFLPSKALAMVGISGNVFPIPSYTPIDVNSSDQSKKFEDVELYLIQHMTSTDHGLNSLEALFNVSKTGYDTVTLITPTDHNKLSAKVVGRSNTVDGGVDGTAAVEGMTYESFNKFIVDTGNKYQYGTLTELRTKWANHISLFENKHKASVTNFLIHNTNTHYRTGCQVRVPGTPSNLVIQATNNGMSAPIEPDFGKRITNKSEINQLIDEVTLLKIAVEGTNIPPAEIAARAEDIRQKYLNHLVSTDSHYFTSASTMTHTPNHAYELGEVVYGANLPSGFALECIKEGTSSEVAPELIANTVDPEDAGEASQIGYNDYINDTIRDIDAHEEDVDAHFDGFGEYLLRAKNKAYSVGNSVWLKDMNPSHKLECIKAGTTANDVMIVDIDAETNKQALINLLNDMMNHTINNNSHREVLSNRLMHKPNEPYGAGETVHAPGLCSSLMLEATTNGITSIIKPAFLKEPMAGDRGYTGMINKRTQIEALNNPTDNDLTTHAKDVAQLLNDHEVVPDAHYYTASTCLKHTPNRHYSIGDIVYAPNIDLNYALECISPGYTSENPPSSISPAHPTPKQAGNTSARGLEEYVSNIRKELNKHDEDSNAHENAFANSILRIPDTEYSVGKTVILNRAYKLKCITAGKSSSQEILGQVDPLVVFINRLINVETKFVEHLKSDYTHMNSITRDLMHRTSHSYKIGDVVRIPGSPTYRLQAITNGTTSQYQPAFDGRSKGTDAKISEAESRISMLKILTNTSLNMLASIATEIAQDIADHEVDTRAHYYSNANSMVHMTSQSYKVGDVVIAPNMNRDYKLECIKAGTTSYTPPIQIDNPDRSTTTVANADPNNLSQYIDAMEAKLKTHDTNPDSHGHEFGRDEIHLASKFYDTNTIVISNNIYSLKCTRAGNTASTRLDMAAKAKLACLIDAQQELILHQTGINVHFNIPIAAYMHRTGARFYAGQEVYVPGVPNGLVLVATNTGQTAINRPAAFTAGRTIDSDSEVNAINSRINTFRNTNPTEQQVASFATEVMRAVENHDVNPAANFTALGEMHAPSHTYNVGDEVYFPNSPNNDLKLRCVKKGKSAATSPFYNKPAKGVIGAAVDTVLDYIKHIKDRIVAHNNDFYAHEYASGSIISRMPSTEYKVGDTVILNRSFKLKCITAGKTNTTKVIEVKDDPRVELNRLINLELNYIDHLKNDYAHYSSYTRGLVQHPSTIYQANDMIRIPGESGLLLMATKSGRTSDVRPAFGGRSSGTDARVATNNGRLASIRAVIDPTAAIVANYATQIAQDIADHEVDTRAHYYSNANSMVHMTSQSYKVGDVVIAPNMNRDYKLECIKAGTTAAQAPETIDGPNRTAADVIRANEREIHAYITNLEKKLVNHDQTESTHGHEFGRDEIHLASKPYDTGSIVISNNIYSLKCTKAGTTASTRLDMAAKAKLACVIDAQRELVLHQSGINVHFNIPFAQYMHRTGEIVYAGQEVYVPGVPNGLVLVATNTGQTSITRPSAFTAGRTVDNDPEIDSINSRINTFRNTNPTEQQVANFATEVMQSVENHDVNPGANFTALGEMHAPSRTYNVGDEVYFPNSPTNDLKLRCIKKGKTAATSPFYNKTAKSVVGAAVDNILDYTKRIKDNIIKHNNNFYAHEYASGSIISRMPSTDYKVGDTVILNRSFKLRCITDGTTSDTKVIEVKDDPKVELNRLINLEINYIDHLKSDYAHYSSYTRGLVQHPSTIYQTNDVVMAPAEPTLLLQATKSGRTNEVRPAFGGRSSGTDSRVAVNNNRLASIRAVTNPTASIVATYASQIAQDIADHEVDTRAHYYSNANSMVHMTSQSYKVGDVVIAPNMNRDYKLECIKAGTTAAQAPETIDGPNRTAADVIRANEREIHAYITNLEKKLVNHDQTESTHGHEFGRDELLLPNTNYKNGDVAIYNHVYKAKCNNTGGRTGSRRLNLEAKARLGGLIDIQKDLIIHASSNDNHATSSMGRFLHKTNMAFTKGQEVYVPGAPNGMVLVATTSGTTSTTRPAAFTAGRTIDSDLDVQKLTNRMNQFKTMTPSDSELALLATEVAQSISDHNSADASHFKVYGGTHGTNRTYNVGDEVYFPNSPTNRWKLHCITKGKTANVAPSEIGHSIANTVIGAAEDLVVDYTNRLRGSIDSHNINQDAHDSALRRSGFMKTGHKYQIGDVVDIDTRWKYECIKSGKNS